MTIEEEMFKGKEINRGSLLAFGFVRDGADYFYKEEMLDGAFQAQVWLRADGSVHSRVWDLDLEEEYTAFRVSQVRGAFVGQVRQAYTAVLEKIVAACSHEKLAISQQGIRLVEYIAKEWGDVSDRPFEKHPQYFSYRVAGKWYALVFPLQMGKLDSTVVDREVEVVNIKVPAEKMEQVLALPSVYPSYHMSKKSWVSVVLDDGLSDAELFSLLAASRSLTAPKGYYPSSGPDYWLIPANPKVFDLDAEFAEHKIVYWTQKATIQKGDLVAMYVTSPAQELRYLCKVLASQVPNTLYPEEGKKSLMQVELIHTFLSQEFPLERMKELGVKSVRGPRRMTKVLAEAVEESLKHNKP